MVVIPGVSIVGSVAQVAMALFIIYIRRKAIGLSQRSNEENRTELSRVMRGSTAVGEQGDQDGHSVPLLPTSRANVDRAHATSWTLEHRMDVRAVDCVESWIDGWKMDSRRGAI
jgi:hypothetical protein